MDSALAAELLFVELFSFLAVSFESLFSLRFSETDLSELLFILELFSSLEDSDEHDIKNVIKNNKINANFFIIKISFCVNRQILNNL
ncbi:hypothetical protein CNEO4_390041 [Clostridium neonatale]|nr:hypothetical protein CNEO_470066 [Clostridium neonatale]CAI3643911.1 hypothetical protein CNEO4_390041 [Clostridium neonatale]CAI3654112.1 hypothetical protein CNEO4_390041 [Clostridium neonatale]